MRAARRSSTLLPDTAQKYLGLYNDTRRRIQDGNASQHADGSQELRRACLGRRRLRGIGEKSISVRWLR